MVKENINMIVENFRNADGGFDTDIECDECGYQTEVYVDVQGTVLCKGCLNGLISLIDRRIVESFGKSERFTFE